MNLTSKLKSLLLGLVLLLPTVASAATVTYLSAATNPSTTASATYTTSAFTPTAGSVQFGGCIVSGTAIEPPTITNSLGGTYTEVDSITRSTNDRLYAFVADQTSTASSQTITIDVTGDNGTGGFCIVYEADITRTGSDALQQAIAVSENTAGPSNPTVTFGSNVNTANITFGCVALGANPATVTEPTGWTEGGDTGYDTPTTGMECVYRNSGFTGTQMQWGSSESAYAAFGIELNVSAAASPPAFSVNPSCSAATNGVSCTYTADADSTLYGVGVVPADGPPTCTQIKAGQNDAGSAALFTGSDANTGSVSDTISVTGTNKPARLEPHFCLSNAGGDSSVYSHAELSRSADAGQTITEITSVAGTSIFADTAYWNPDFAGGDWIEFDSDTNEDSGCSVAFEADGDFSLTPDAAGDCDGKRTFHISYQDDSEASTGLFSSPSVGNFATDDLVCVNNSAPEAGDPFEAPLVWTEDQAIEALDLSGYFTDADGDTLTFTLTTGTWPTGVSQSGTGNKDVTGTPTTENEAGVALVVTATDECGDSDTFSFYDDTSEDVYVVNTWTVPDVVGLTVPAAEASVITDAPWRVLDALLVVAGTECSEETEGTIISQDPAASAEAGAFDPIEVITAVECGDPGVERKVVYVLADLTGLVRWVDYIPVSEVIGCAAGTFEENGCWATLPLSSTTGKTAWVDYIPVGEVDPVATGKWRYENNGWIPVDDLTP